MRCAKLFLRCSHRKGLVATLATFWRNNRLSQLEEESMIFAIYCLSD